MHKIIILNPNNMKAATNYLNEITIQYEKKLFGNFAVKTSKDAEIIAREIYAITGSKIEVKEYFFILLINRAHGVLGFVKLSEGGICGTLVDTRLAFASALKGLATGIILLHNHPSGNVNPSETDIQLTRKFRKIGELHDIAILDHIIITATGYYSFEDNGV